MSWRGKPIYFLVLFLFVFNLSPALGGEATPRQTVKNLLDAIGKLKTEGELSLEQRKMNHELSQRALTLLDLREVSQKALGKYWAERTPKEQDGFVELLSRMFVQAAFPNSGKFFSDLKLVYGETRIKKSQVLVPVTVIHQKEGEVGIDFYLRKNGGHWQVVDVALDEVSMRNNLRTQFYKIIKKKDYQDLVRRLQKKLEETKG